MNQSKNLIDEQLKNKVWNFYWRNVKFLQHINSKRNKKILKTHNLPKDKHFFL